MKPLVRRLRDRLGAEDGFTLVELLAVIAILGVVLGGLTALFTSGANSELDQNNRAQAQQQARVSLDRLRREARCASGVTYSGAVGTSYSTVSLALPGYCTRTTLSSAVTLPSSTIAVATTNGFASGSNTISFANSTAQTTVTCTGTTGTTFTGCSGGSAGTYAAGAVVTNTSATTVTWCATGAAAPYSLMRYVSSSCSGSGTSWSDSLVSNGVFSRYAQAAASTTVVSSGGTLSAGSYYYEVTPVLASGAEVPGTITGVVSVTSGTSNEIKLSWSAYSGASSYNVYGRDSSGLRLLATVPSTTTTYTDYGPTYTTDNPLTLPSSTINVLSTQGFNSGGNTIQLGVSGPITCTGTTSTSFTGCTGGLAGTYAQPTTVYSYSTVRPPSTTLGVKLVVNPTPTNTTRQFTLSDNVVLRNSRPF